jgi:ADP-heptose:LPS heptosyltransferase
MESFDFENVRKVLSKEIPSSAIRQFGNVGQIVYVKHIEDLRNNPPNIVIAECVKNVSFTQNNFKVQKLKKKSKYIMNLGVYKQLWFDTYNKQRVLKPANIKFKNIYKPYRGYDLNNKTLLIFRTGGIGDLLFSLPNLMFLKKKYPSCKIQFACGPQYHAMVDNWESVDEVLSLPFSVSSLIQADYHAVFEGVIERCEEATTINAYRLFTRWLGLNLSDDLLIPEQKAKQDKVKACKIWIEKSGIDKNFIIVQLRASSPIRTPRPQIWEELICKLVDIGYHIVITDTPSIAKQIDQFINDMGEKYRTKIFNFARFSPTLDFSIALTSLAKCSVSPDSSLIHIAASLGVPAFGIYGAFSGNIRLSTYKHVDWIEAKKDCAPCFIHSSKLCKYSKEGHPVCYDSINIDECIEKIERLIKHDKNNYEC